MATNPLVKQALLIIKEEKVSLAASGPECVVVFDKGVEQQEKLAQALGLLGFKKVEDTEDKAAGLITYATPAYNNVKAGENKSNAIIQIIIFMIGIIFVSIMILQIFG